MKIASLVVLVGCAGPIETMPPHSEPHGYAGRMASADEHDAKADQHAARLVEAKKAPPAWTCGWDPNLDDVATSGGERLAPTTPCWNTTEQQVAFEKKAEIKERAQAHTDRAVAANMVEAEVARCGKLPERDRMRSPFAHARLIASASPMTEDGVVRGAYVVFERVSALTVGRMKASLDCNRSAYATLGKPADFAPYDPTLVEGAIFSVDQTAGGNIRVLITSPDNVDAKIILERALALATKTATR